MDGASRHIHATAIAVGDRAALIRGPSGSGKSDLALRCLAMGQSPLVEQPARLIADDQVIIHRIGARLSATAPASLKGLIEVRGIGIASVDATDQADVVLIVDLLPDGVVAERLPQPWPTVRLLDLAVPQIRISAFEPSAAIKTLLALGGKAVLLPPVCI